MIDVPHLFEIPSSRDDRGTFSKPFHSGNPISPEFVVREIFWTTSSQGAIRGMHFQTPPHAIGKLVWVSRGAIIDVVVDLRKGSCGTVSSFPLNDETSNVLWVPSGFAHGFQALTDGATVNYATDGAFEPLHDKGIRWDSVGFVWPLAPTQISVRDQSFSSLNDYSTPF